jgi:CubicO group peptidase (beta-lactamase class C family)
MIVLILSLFIPVHLNGQQENEKQFANLDELHQYLSTKTENNEFSGVVLIAKDGKSIFKNAYGYASKRFEVPNSLDTKFNIGSLSKHITGIAILQLVEKGLLKLEDPIGKYLSGFPESIASKVTVKYLVTMSSGWGDYWDNEIYNAHRYEYRTVSHYINFIKDIPLDFEPGTNMQHSNIGFEIAGAIIEEVSGQSYYDFVRNNIYSRADMLNSDSYHLDGPVKNLAVGYTNEHPFDTLKNGYKWSNIYMRLPARGTPTGGSFSTVEDLLKLDQAQRRYKFLSKDYTNHLLNLFQGKIGDDFMGKKGIIHIVGGAEGVGAILGLDMMDEDMSKGYTIIILSNYDFPVALDIYKIIKQFVIKLKSK